MDTRRSAHYKYNLTAVILAGGKSSRMGKDKAFLTCGTMTMVERAVELVKPFVSGVIVVTNKVDQIKDVLDDDSVHIISDDCPNQGPLGGIASAVNHITTPFFITRAVDMPWLADEFIDLAYSELQDFDVAVPTTARGIEPLCALYRTKAVKQWAQRVLDTGRRRVIALYPHLRVNQISPEIIHMVDSCEVSFMNANYPDQFSLVQQELKSGWKTVPDNCFEFNKRYKTLEHSQSRTKQLQFQKNYESEPIVKFGHQFDLAYQLPRKDRRGRDIKILYTKPGAQGLPLEYPVTIMLNGIEIATVQTSLSHLEDMAIGFLVSEGLLTNRHQFKSVELDKKHGVVYVSSDEGVPSHLVKKTEQRYITSGCGKGVTFTNPSDLKTLDSCNSEVVFEPDDLNTWITQMSHQSQAYKNTGGSHSCGIVIDGKLETIREDVGRHNAVDKVIGDIWLRGLPVEKAVLLSTGRLSYEIVAKAARQGIPVVASRSGATSMAASIAEELNLTLVGYVRLGQISIFTHPQRIVGGMHAFIEAYA